MIEQAEIDCVLTTHAAGRERKWGLAASLAAALLAGAGGGWWWTERNAPITPEHRRELTALAARAADHSGRTPQAVWAQAKRVLGVAKVEEIRRKDLDMARRALAVQM